MFETRGAKAIKGLFILLILGIVAGSMLLHLVNPVRGARLEMLRHHHDRLDTHVSRLAQDNERLSAELNALETTTHAWRDVARREFGMIGRGEVVYRFPVREQR